MLKEHGCLGVPHGNMLFIFVFTEVQMEEVSLDHFVNQLSQHGVVVSI